MQPLIVMRRTLLPVLLSLTAVACSPKPPTLLTYEKDGVSFDHYSDWKVTGDVVIEPATQSRTIDLEGPRDAIVTVMLLPTSADLKVDEFAASIASERGAAVKETLSIGSFSVAKVSETSSQAASAPVGGRLLSGIRHRFSITLLGQEVPHEAAFFQVPGQPMSAIVMTQVATEHAGQTAAAFDATLRSLRLGATK